MKYCKTVKGLVNAIQNGEQACLKYDAINHIYIYDEVEIIISEDNKATVSRGIFEQIRPYLSPRKQSKEVWVVAIIDNYSGSPHYGRKTYARKAIVKSGKIETSVWFEYAKHFETRDAAVKYVKNTLKGTVDNEYGYTLYRLEKVWMPIDKGGK